MDSNRAEYNPYSELRDKALMELLEGKPELLEGDARILDMPFNSDVGNHEVEVKAAVPPNMAMQDQMKQLMNLQRELKETMTRITEAMKAKTDAHSARVKEEISREDKMVKKDIAAGGTAVVCAAKEKTIPLAISKGFQSAVNQLEKSVNSKLEATVSREIQAQFQTSGKQALQDALESGIQASMVPAFEKLCKAMFEKVIATIQKGMGEHETAAQQHVESAHSLLAHTIREAKRSALSATQTLSGKVDDGHRKLVAFAAGRGNSSAVDPRVSQLTSGFHKNVEVPLDPTKELPRLVAEGKYEPLAHPHSVEEDQEQSTKVSGLATTTTMSQLQTLYANSRKQEWKNMQASGPSSPSPGVLNSIESSNEAGGSSSPPSGEAAVPQIMSLQDMMNQQMDMQRQLQDQITKMIMARPDDVFSLLYPAIMLKHPTHPMTPITPSEILMAASSFDSNTASSSYMQQLKLIADCADMLRRNKAVYDAEHKKKEEAEHKKKKKIAQDEVSSVLNPRIMFKHPTYPLTPITPSEILMAACSSENTNAVDCNTASSSYVQLMELPEGKPELLEGDARILDMLFNSDVGNPEVEVKDAGDARSTEIDKSVPQRELQNAFGENKEKFSCSQTSDLGIGMALNYAISSEFYITKEARHGDGASMSEALAQPHSAKVSGSATATTTSQLETPNAKSRKQEWKNMQASGPSSPSPGVLNSIESSNEAGGSSSPPSGEAAVPQIMSLQDMRNQQMDMQRKLQDQITMMIMAQDDVFSVLNPDNIFRHPTHPMTPAEILLAPSSSENTEDFADMLKRKKAVLDALVVEKAEHKKKKEEAEHTKKKKTYLV